jgi:hypothetical protein
MVRYVDEQRCTNLRNAPLGTRHGVLENATGQVMTARDKFRADVAEALTDWRLGVPPMRSIPSHIAQDAICEILRLRLWIAYMPLFETLTRIEKRLDVICNLRADPYAPPVKRHD